MKSDINSFSTYLQQWPPERVRQLIQQTNTPSRVAQAIKADELDETDLAALLSPAAEKMLEPMARRSALLTRRRFGHTIQFYTPLYVSNYCVNSCLYCGFNCRNQVERRTLSISEAETEAQILAKQGFQHILLVSGEDRDAVPVDYFTRLIKRLKPRFASVALEIYPMTEDEYREMAEAGVDSLTLYQETYIKEEYEKFHPAGPKKNFEYRLAAIERAARAGITFLGIGALLGLSEWNIDGFYAGLHARWLNRHYWRSHVSVSFPRLRMASGNFKPRYSIEDAAMVQLIAAQRLFLPEAGLVLSTRENAEFRDHVIPLGITRISAGSKTSPGGYSQKQAGEQQFAVQDHRSLKKMMDMVEKLGFEPVNKDWDCAYHPE